VEPIMRALAGLDPALLVAATVGLTALEATALLGLVIPGDLVVLLAAGSAATIAANGHAGPFGTAGRLALVLIAAAVGTWLGELAGYAIGRGAGLRLRGSRPGRWLGEARWVRAERYLAGRGARALVPVRFVSVLHAVAPIVAGTVRMPARRFAFWSALGAVIWAATYTAVGAGAGAAYRQYGDLGLCSSVAVIAATGVVLGLRRRRNRRRGTAGAEPAGEPVPAADVPFRAGGPVGRRLR
jgi:membrane-associated protein